MTPGLDLAGEVVPQTSGINTDADVTIDGADLDIAIRVRAWWFECVNSEFWQTYTEEAEEDEGYYIGGEFQWSHKGDTSALERLKKQGRAHVTANHCAAPIDSVTGYERQNRTDAKALPQGDEDVESARIMSWLLKHVQDSCDANDILSDVFEDGVITGLRAAEIGIDWQRGTRGGLRRAGQAYLENLKCGLGKDAELVWDPKWKEYSGRDARYFLRWRWVYVEDAEAQWPEQKEAFRASLARLDQHMTTAIAGGATVRLDDYPDAPGTLLSPKQVELYLYNPHDRQVLICDAWYHVYDQEWCVIEKRTGRLIPFADRKREAVDFAATDPDRLKVERQIIRRVRMSVTIPATATTLERDTNPYPNDDEDYPFALFITKRKGRHVYGLIRNMKDPQRVENKRLSQLLDIVDRFARLRMLVQENSLPNPQAFQDPLDDSPVFYKKGPDVERPAYLVPPIAEIAPVLIGLADKMKVLLREIPGVNTEYNVGLRAPDASGRAIQERVAQGQLVSTVVYDHFNRTKKYAHARLARRTQQLYTRDETVRLTGELGETVLVRLNPADAPGAPEVLQGREEYLKEYRAYRTKHQQERGASTLSLEHLHYDIVLAEGPSTPTARTATLRMLLDMLQAVPIPQLAVFFVPTIIRLMDGIPDRDQIMREVEQMKQSMLGGGQPAPAATPPGAPVPVG